MSKSGTNPCEGQKKCLKWKASGGVWESYFMIGLSIYEMSRPSNKKESWKYLAIVLWQVGNALQ